MMMVMFASRVSCNMYAMVVLVRVLYVDGGNKVKVNQGLLNTHLLRTLLVMQ